ncbi:DUF1549 and DUF1553 domain-containing protein [Schlesneria sp. DSM 10557]|uniref:DUF1549 and DUF1553 domain-containing protein n=1 Tax=Schlesneria sp. DSM 10557 TaxID=3044399 RepID=UPI0035A1AF2B
MRWSTSFVVTAGIFILFSQQTRNLVATERTISISPPAVVLDRPESSEQILITEWVGTRQFDRTREVQYSVADPAIIDIRADGLVHPRGEGTTQLIITRGADRLTVPVTVSGLNDPQPVSFPYEIQPQLTKARCNSGGCHGKAEGQNGFKLSLLGFDNESDFDALVKESGGRRLDFARPETSLILQKGTARMPHGGGAKIDRSGPGYNLMLRWIREGAPFDSPTILPTVRIEIEPAELIMDPKSSQQIKVTAMDTAGKRQCVTTAAEFISNAASLVETTSSGLIHSREIPGEAAILVRYLDQVAVCRVTLPRPHPETIRPQENNFIDRHVGDKLVRLGIPASPPADDSTFLRRVFLDTIGTLPTSDEARAFLSDNHPEKRIRIIDSLLTRPEYAEFWAMKWSDILRADKIKITPQGTVGVTRWLRKCFAENLPYDEFARQILTSQGSIQQEGPAAFFKSLETPEATARSVSQLFLGVRIECAQCHHHPSEKWSQDDYAGLVGFFTGVAFKKLPNGTESVISGKGNDYSHPRTGLPVATRGLGAPPADLNAVADRRQAFAAWMTDSENPFFARAIVNRLWAHYLGRGLVEPIDDLRATNPSTNEPLMDHLVTHLKELRYDLKAFTKTILSSQTYQLASATKEGNRDDFQHYSHALTKTMPAEVLLDAVCQVTLVPEKFNGWPEGYRAIQVWDNRMPSYFFRIFGRPVRASVCECERSNEPSISQALHLLNSPEIHEKITHPRGRARQLAESSLTDAELLDELFLCTLTRFPSESEKGLLLPELETAQADRRAVVEDIFWSILNTKEFLFNNE